MRTLYINDEEIYNKYGVFLQSKNIPLPEPRMHYVDVEGGNGALDLSTALTNGHVRYQDREGCSFVLLSMDGNYADARNRIAQDIHGKRVKIELSEEPGSFYYGRVWVSEWEWQRGDLALFTLEGRLEPFRYGTPFGEDEVTVSGETDHTITNDGVAPIAPLFTTSAEMDMWHGDILYRLFEGENDISMIVEPGESTTVTFDGTGTVTVTYQERMI